MTSFYASRRGNRFRVDVVGARPAAVATQASKRHYFQMTPKEEASFTSVLVGKLVASRKKKYTSSNYKASLAWSTNIK